MDKTERNRELDKKIKERRRKREEIMRAERYMKAEDRIR